jgi:hypothetical protein
MASSQADVTERLPRKRGRGPNAPLYRVPLEIAQCLARSCGTVLRSAADMATFMGGGATSETGTESGAAAPAQQVNVTSSTRVVSTLQPAAGGQQAMGSVASGGSLQSNQTATVAAHPWVPLPFPGALAYAVPWSAVPQHGVSFHGHTPLALATPLAWACCAQAAQAAAPPPAPSPAGSSDGLDLLLGALAASEQSEVQPPVLPCSSTLVLHTPRAADVADAAKEGVWDEAQAAEWHASAASEEQAEQGCRLQAPESVVADGVVARARAVVAAGGEGAVAAQDFLTRAQVGAGWQGGDAMEVEAVEAVEAPAAEFNQVTRARDFDEHWEKMLIKKGSTPEQARAALTSDAVIAIKLDMLSMVDLLPSAIVDVWWKVLVDDFANVWGMFYLGMQLKLKGYGLGRVPRMAVVPQPGKERDEQVALELIVQRLRQLAPGYELERICATGGDANEKACQLATNLKFE